METTEILKALPAAAEWMVLFRLPAIRSLADDTQMRAMFFLPEELDLTSFSHVILTSVGRYLAPEAGSSLHGLNGGQSRAGSGGEVSLYDRYCDLLNVFPPDEADCLGFGKKGDLPPVVLHLTINVGGYGHAKAIFHRKPSGLHYELLEAAGVTYEGGYSRGRSFVAFFRNTLSTHIHSGSLAGYSRTGNCNQFFLNHGEIDRDLEAGLIQASEARSAWARNTGLAAACHLARKASEASLAMTCQPPSPGKRFPYGDLVPLGFLLRALTQGSSETLAEPVTQLRERVLAARQGLLWPFHTGRLVTATDSVLILQGLPGREAIEALEQFSDGQGGYFPQLWSERKEPGRMVIDEANAHWCQPDFATTCLVRGLRAEAGLPSVTPVRYLEDRFETRSGLYFANPYLTDWALATAIGPDRGAAGMRRKLEREILAAMNEDHSFGTFDPALSTSFAILALTALGCRGRLLRLAQLRLLEMMDPRTGLWPECAPFYSTFQSGLCSKLETGNSKFEDGHRASTLEIQVSNGGHALPAEGQMRKGVGGPAPSPLWGRGAEGEGMASGHAPSGTGSQILDVDGRRHELSLYFDSHRIIATAVAVRALSEPCDPTRRDIELKNREGAHPRYRCGTHAEYIADFALPPYVSARASLRLPQGTLCQT